MHLGAFENCRCVPSTARSSNLAGAKQSKTRRRGRGIRAAHSSLLLLLLLLAGNLAGRQGGKGSIEAGDY